MNNEFCPMEEFIDSKNNQTSIIKPVNGESRSINSKNS
jgi:hypothetical protein